MRSVWSEGCVRGEMLSGGSGSNRDAELGWKHW